MIGYRVTFCRILYTKPAINKSCRGRSASITLWSLINKNKIYSYLLIYNFIFNIQTLSKIDSIPLSYNYKHDHNMINLKYSKYLLTTKRCLINKALVRKKWDEIWLLYILCGFYYIELRLIIYIYIYIFLQLITITLKIYKYL